MPVNNININLKKEKDNDIKMWREMQFYPVFDDLMNNQRWLSLIEEELTWNEKSSKKLIEKTQVPKVIIVIESNNKEKTDKKREIIVINNSDEVDD